MVMLLCCNSGNRLSTFSIVGREDIQQEQDPSVEEEEGEEDLIPVFTIIPSYSDLKNQIELIIRNETWIFKTSYELSTTLMVLSTTVMVEDDVTNDHGDDVNSNNRKNTSTVGGREIQQKQQQQQQQYIRKREVANKNIIKLKESNYLPPKRRLKNKVLCRDECCVETSYISTKQDSTKLLNWRNDIQDISDIMIQQFDNQYATVHSTNLYDEKLIKCFIPGTIISVDNFEKSINYFWKQIRPQITVPFVLLTGGSDNNSPYISKHTDNPRKIIQQYLSDPLLIRWYGMNPLLPLPLQLPPSTLEEVTSTTTTTTTTSNKFRPLLSGLSYLHPQERYLSTYLKLINYTNPFSSQRIIEKLVSTTNNTQNDKNKNWTKNTSIDIDFDRDIFVHFGRKRNPLRQHLWNILCPPTTGGSSTTANNKSSSSVSVSSVSCNEETNHLPMHDIYTDMTSLSSQYHNYKFGISPPGAGYDCYRHYEMLYLGIIPIIWDNRLTPQDQDQDNNTNNNDNDNDDNNDLYYLYKDLPVILLNNTFSPSNIKNRNDIILVVKDFLNSEKFHYNLKHNVYAKGWERLFLKSKRDEFNSNNNWSSSGSNSSDKTTATTTTTTSTSATTNTVINPIYCYYADENCVVTDATRATATSADQEWIHRWNNNNAL
ncbi:hypothetical protein FRACYDRAFT_250065 [Fragilariopsis cylindrus CCMP1102]|uniref:Exostosin GT47 domain-containing protein n=1 Tax=Fragilariopsis cylindrus CCMP1102 TaxID=635003 RepID=A0A1E7ER28_9STRA|nr:hypothetical protein FRACYDRAFT_250065 [Fragilariopsis cylindrus CCMP1102]|eukprot:OEU08276.1 hypothetical protein FRACYDRAFT_250065 [Fragilariopsis cylindrus CCMP1102]